MNRFQEWLEHAIPGDKIMYMQVDHASRKPNVARFFRDAAHDGKVFLYQQRIEFGLFNYYAQRVSKETGERIKPCRR